MKIHEREHELRELIRDLLETQKLTILSTQRNGQPYSSLMAFAHTDSLDTILVATGSATRKYGNISTEPRVSLLFDNRSNETSDFHQACALTALGKAQRVTEPERHRYEMLYIDKHPYLEQFMQAPSTVFLKITVFHYLLVNRFQQVMELHLIDEIDLFTS